MAILPKNLTKQTKIYLYIFLFTIFSGALRKWLFNSAAVGNAIFGLQLALLFTYVFFDKEAIRTVFKNPLIKLYFGYLIFSAVNPLNATIYHGFFGILLHFGFWFIGFYYIENREKFDFKLIIRILIIVCFAELILATVQYGLPSDNFLNRYSDKNYTDIAKVGDSVRVTGSFSFIAGFTSYLLFHAYFVWVLIKIKYDARVTIALLMFGFVGAFMSGSRGGGYIYFLLAGYMLVFVAKGGIIKSILTGVVFPVALFFTFSLITGTSNFQTKIIKAYDNYVGRATTLREQGEESGRISGEYVNLLNFRGENPLFGIGLGSAYQGAIVLFGTSDAYKKYGFIESESEKVVLEGGFILYALKIFLIIAFCKRLAVDTLSKFLIGALLYLSPPLYNVFNSMFAFLGIAMVDNFYYREKLKLFYTKAPVNDFENDNTGAKAIVYS